MGSTGSCLFASRRLLVCRLCCVTDPRTGKLHAWRLPCEVLRPLLQLSHIGYFSHPILARLLPRAVHWDCKKGLPRAVHWDCMQAEHCLGSAGHGWLLTRVLSKGSRGIRQRVSAPLGNKRRVDAGLQSCVRARKHGSAAGPRRSEAGRHRASRWLGSVHRERGKAWHLVQMRAAEHGHSAHGKAEGFAMLCARAGRGARRPRGGGPAGRGRRYVSALGPRQGVSMASRGVQVYACARPSP